MIGIGLPYGVRRLVEEIVSTDDVRLARELAHEARELVDRLAASPRYREHLHAFVQDVLRNRLQCTGSAS